MRIWIRRLSDGLAWLALAIAAISLVLREVTWSWQPAIVAAAFAPYFVLAALVAVTLFVIRHRWIGLALAIAATVTVAQRIWVVRRQALERAASQP